jgi:hypothetical protein
MHDVSRGKEKRLSQRSKKSEKPKDRLVRLRERSSGFRSILEYRGQNAGQNRRQSTEE